ncbi:MULTISPECIES: S41 family peptidase [Thalassospira]|jgi:carboxyl-terminal processing protease|uniref:S41 family peptidase n=2 Tax=Thalassospira TaxID=168934 RepID=A0A8I1MAH4_9PROT|nr:S41 family peptidase [Thalassospira povalilytica]KZB59040.1 peptidase S41 [Thalassospira sp. MCCC 1A02491]MBO6771454.1 S41 family peptidase [Thalassospira sp.]MBN8198425.1 S41 family peptidase [Thalassospira povalilytica]MCC4241815.1 S41 family peptidase [Thalassospira povalilytica]PKR49338.1 S41 family peptidase [Thalassospira povalilytica]|tara:strand:+ start:1819 stop:3120 length:1302 start_codon:yes stop_codon:yes gene_type:complete|eukprot:TRINITY_DN5464_c0_g1_i3.p1 TRINITY_DN5464_c0_g1~~TRINITY_DN5464_c0_g1_i3.p1  ORF type:complete len:434 (+),score=105.09 TRINITY_DN5464_c0_g1_i3:156-1457(+)
MKTSRLAVLALATGMTFGLASPSLAQSSTSSAETYRLLNLFGDVFEQVKAKYVEEVDDKQLIEAAINGMLTSLDPHSSYLNMDNFEEMQVDTRGEFGGLGIEVTMEDGFVKVIAPIYDTPAEKAGLQPGDFITHIDGTAIRGMTLNDAVEMMRGKVNTDIVLTIIRKGEQAPFDVTLTRAVIKIQSVRAEAKDDIGYIRITKFNEQTFSGLQRAIGDMRDQIGPEIKGLVIDLRNNPGGLLDQAISVSDAFLDKGEIVSTRPRDTQNTERYNARSGDLAEGLPIVVLINDGSASASEIVAGALQDHRRAVIMGTRSFGKGSVQTILPMPGNVALRLTTARYYTPSGKSIQEVGIVPDIIVPQARVESIESDTRRSEASLNGALRNEDAATTDAEKDANSRRDEAEQLAIDDYQLSRALDMIRGISLFGPRPKG